jgi:hypothetical protein
MFYIGAGSDHFLIPDPDPNIFHPASYINKWNANLPYLFLASYAFRSKVLVLVKMIRDPEKFIPDPKGK